MTASETSVTEASIPMVTTFTGTATVLPVSTAVFKISESWRQKQRERDEHSSGRRPGSALIHPISDYELRKNRNSVSNR